MIVWSHTDWKAISHKNKINDMKWQIIHVYNGIALRLIAIKNHLSLQLYGQELCTIIRTGKISTLTAIKADDLNDLQKLSIIIWVGSFHQVMTIKSVNTM